MTTLKKLTSKNFIRRAAALVLALTMLLSLAACTKKEEGGQKEPDKKVFKIGVMQFGEFTALENARKGFVEGLAELGFKEGDNVVYNTLSAAADTSNCPTIADTLINDGSDLIFAIATPSIMCAKEKTSDIPLLFTAVTDPVGSGIVANASGPGGNITGTSDMNPVKEQIDLLIKLIPSAKTVAVLYTSSESNSAAQYALAKAALEAKGLTCLQKTISAIDEAKSAIESLKGQADAIYIPTDNVISDGMAGVSAVANENKIPTIVGEPGMVENGAFATFGIDYTELGKQTAAMAAKVLNADDPLKMVGSIAVGYQTEECKIAVNKAAAEALGITIPEDIMKDALVY